MNRNFLCQFDAFAKPLKDFRVQTVTGAFVSIVSSLVIGFLFISELQSFLTPTLKQEIVVDINRGNKMAINVDITLFHLPCSLLNLDTMDTTGEQQIDVQHEVYKTQVDTSGRQLSKSVLHQINSSKLNRSADLDYCGSCYGAESPSRNCCNTCKDIQLAYHEKHWVITNMSLLEQCQNDNWEDDVIKIGSEGCRIHGNLQVNKVAGSFHISPGSSFSFGQAHVHSLEGLTGKELNMTHTINTLSFGATYPGQVNPLDSENMIVEESQPMVTYYIKLVPTVYMEYNETNKELVRVETNQYSVTRHVKSTSSVGDSGGIPGLFFTYELSPILVKISYENKSVLHFLTNTCAIIGGVFTVASLLDAFIYQSTRVMRKRFSDYSR